MSHRTELSFQEKGKILAYMENFNPAQIARKIGHDPTTIHRFIDKYKKTGKTENLLWLRCHLTMRKMHL